MDVLSEALSTPVNPTSYDLIVCGGGVAGVAAAVAARRQGLQKVLLIEKSITIGGLATAGLIGWYEPLCDGEGRKLSTALSQELFEIAVKYSYHCIPDEWIGFPEQTASDRRCASFFSPAVFAMALDEFLQDNGVEVLLDTLVTRPVMEGSRITAVVTEEKGGRCAYRTKVIIDCTGDADIMYRAGVPCEAGLNWLTYIAYQSTMETIDDAKCKNSMQYASYWRNSGSDLFGNGHPQDVDRVSGLTAEEVTYFVRAGRQRLLDGIKEGNPFARDIVAAPSMAQLRTTRHIVGARTLTEEDQGVRQEDSIAACGDFVHAGKWYEIPYGTLYDPAYPNLLAAGRIIGARGWAWDVTRVIPCAVSTAQAAGTAAALAISERIPVHAVDIGNLQERLERQGVRLHA